MNAHVPAVETLGDGLGVRSTCSCGWRGDWRAAGFVDDQFEAHIDSLPRDRRGIIGAWDDAAFAWADLLEAFARSLRLSARRIREGRGRR